jgi:hypothetical protein
MSKASNSKLLFAFYPAPNTGDHDNVKALYDGMPAEDTVKAGFHPNNEIANIIERAQSDKDNAYMLLVVGQDGAKRINDASNIPGNVKIFWTGHQTTKELSEAVSTKKIAHVYVSDAGIGHANELIYKQAGASVTTLPGVPVMMDGDKARQAYEAHKENGSFEFRVGNIHSDITANELTETQRKAISKAFGMIFNQYPDIENSIINQTITKKELGEAIQKKWPEKDNNNDCVNACLKALEMELNEIYPLVFKKSQENEAHKENFLTKTDSKRRIIFHCNGDAPDIEGKYRYFSREEGETVGITLAKLAQQYNAVIEIITGPRTGMMDPDTGRKTLAHQQWHTETGDPLLFTPDATSSGIQTGLVKAGLTVEKDFKFHHFQWGTQQLNATAKEALKKRENIDTAPTVSMYELAIGLALVERDAIIIYTGESITEGNKIAKYFNGREAFALTVSSMHEGHHAFTDGLHKNGYIGIIDVSGTQSLPKKQNMTPLDPTAIAIKSMIQHIQEVGKEKSLTR